MTGAGVIADTSVLIDFLQDMAPNADAVAALIGSKRILTCGIIMAELLQSTRNTREEAYVTELIEAIPAVEITTALWVKAGKLSCLLRRKGILLPLSDIAIAACAYFGIVIIPLFCYARPHLGDTYAASKR
jgi:predicted nucleic acid-binding protein